VLTMYSAPQGLRDMAKTDALPSPSRLEAFSDGVVAVIITIMVLDFKIPHAPGARAFVPAVLPTLAVYLLSFSFTGIYWINHHHLVDRLKRVDAPILYSNLLFLFALSLLPFCTSYAIAEKFDSFSVAVYAGSLFLSGIGFVSLSMAIRRHLQRHGGVPSEVEMAIQEAEWKKGLLSLTMYGSAIPLAFWHPLAAAGVIAMVTLVWVLPGFLLRAAHEHCGETGAI
jgi:uncharacterized membrane protein